MNKNNRKLLASIKCISGFFVVGILVFLLWGQMALPKENRISDDTCEMLDVSWEQILSDGSQASVDVPGEIEADYGEWITLVAKLPDNKDYNCLCFRSLQQDYKIYVDGELREEYSTLDTQLFGKTSTIAYVFLEVGLEDYGKEIKVEFMSDSFYSGVMSDILIGDKTDVMLYLVKLYAPSTLLSVFMLLLSVGVIFVGVVVYFYYKRNSELFYLGMGVLLASLWLLCESKLRQFILPNSTIAMYMGFFIIMILPYPFLMYSNTVQKRRYEKICTILCVCAIVNFVACTLLQVLNIKDFFETMTSSHIVLIATILFIIITIIIDAKRGYMKQYRSVAIGCVCFLVSGVLEVFQSYITNAKYNGIALCLGLVVLLLMAVVNVGNSILEGEREKQAAIASSESKAQFLANMSHEIRTPINTMLGMNAMIMKESTDETIGEYAGNVDEAGKMLLSLVNTILDFSKIEAGKLEIVENEYSTTSMLKSVALGAKNRAEKKGLKFDLDFAENIPDVLFGDELRIKQILNNLLSNAVKYTEKGSIMFSVKAIDKENGFFLQASIKDTGKGIRQEDLENLFDSFKRLELSKNRHIEGTGLGLNIAKQLTEMMDGELKVESEYGKGSCFTIEIPQKVIEKKLEDVSAKQDNDDRKTEELYAPDSNILAVDDNDMNLKVIAAFLKNSGVNLDFAENGKIALDKTKQKKYDLILMDHMMPEMDGIEALHIIRQNKENINNATKIIVLTANAIAGAEKEYLEEGFDGYLSKPFEPVVFSDTIKKHLSNK